VLHNYFQDLGRFVHSKLLDMKEETIVLVCTSLVKGVASLVEPLKEVEFEQNSNNASTNKIPSVLPYSLVHMHGAG